MGKAQRAAAEGGTEPTIFSRIIARSVPATILYEDDEVGVSGARVTPWVVPTRESSACPPSLSAWCSATWLRRRPSTS